MKNIKAIHICIFLFILYLLPGVIFGENSYIHIHDNLDSEMVWRVVLAHSGKAIDFNANDRIDQIMNGLPRGCLPSGLNVMLWLYMIFNPITAYMLNEILVHTIAFIGMYLLLKRHFLTKEDQAWLVSVSSFVFAVIPFCAIYSLSIAGQPLLFYAFLNIRNKQAKLSDYLIFICMPFYSSFAYDIFVVIVFFGFIAFDTFKKKKLDISALFWVALLTLLYLFMENNLIQLIFFSHFVSIRSAYLPDSSGSWPAGGASFGQALWLAWDNFLNGQYHAVSMHTMYILPASLLALAIGFYRKEKQNSLLWLIGAAALISLWFGIFRWEMTVSLRAHFTILKIFQWDRFHWMHPMIWYAIFALSLARISEIKYGKAIAIILIVLQANLLITNSDIQSNLGDSVAQMQGKTTQLITYRRFFSTDLYAQVKNYIHKPQKDYRVVSLGLHPSIAQYNGFYTLDSYQNIYPLSYKIEFRKIIAKELEKSKRWKKYFDEWGDRCYVFTSDFDGLYIRKKRNLKLKNLEINTRALKKMGGSYIISAVEILNYRHLNLTFLKKFEDEKSPWEIYLYRVD